MVTAGVLMSKPIAPEAGRASAAEDSSAGAEQLPSGEELPCRQDPDLWFAEKPHELERAKAMCGQCPIRAECLAGALSRGEPWGVWGGEIFDRGVVVARKRSRGRPRKHPVAEEQPKGTTRSRGKENAA
ncbi:WhiB family transcriptional regulator [Saccharopolyspora rectivirgula]|jgi:WhiB family redox-sensing transcriptional regulator|uniref:WhiB family transcriptional regulator n=1 Tax=Saccharopolyspora rectivirgula TaxID=28042 RepID=UPI0004164C22